MIALWLVFGRGRGAGVLEAREVPVMGRDRSGSLGSVMPVSVAASTKKLHRLLRTCDQDTWELEVRAVRHPMRELGSVLKSLGRGSCGLAWTRKGGRAGCWRDRSGKCSSLGVPCTPGVLK